MSLVFISMNMEGDIISMHMEGDIETMDESMED